MSDGNDSTKVEKNTNTAENRDFWKRVEGEAKEIRQLPEWKRDQIDSRLDSNVEREPERRNR